MAARNPSPMQKALAAILSHMQPDKRDRLLSNIDGQDHFAADSLRALIFTFDDIDRLSAKDMQLLLRSVEPRDLAVALQGAERSVQRIVVENMSARAAMMLQEDIRALSPAEPDHIEDARSRIAALVMELADQGRIQISDRH